MREKEISYLRLRLYIGLIGLTSPFILPLIVWIFSDKCPFQISISHYYYSTAHILFVGALCLLGAFLLSYKGTTNNSESNFESNIANLTGFCALGVAGIPTGINGFINEPYIIVCQQPEWFKYLHYCSAAALFIGFSIFCFKIFPLPDNGDSKEVFSKLKLRRNKIYKTCGWVILISISIIFSIFFIENFINASIIPNTLFWKYSTTIFESTSLIAFGYSWLLKSTYKLNTNSFALLKFIVKPFREINKHI